MGSTAEHNKIPLRVMFVDHVASVGGAEIALYNLIRHFDFNVIQPVVVLGEEGILADRLKSIAEVHVIPMCAEVRTARKDNLGARSLLLGSAIIGAIRYIYQLIQFIREHNVDLVHTNSLKSDILGGCAAKLAGRPVIWHVRDRITSDYLPSRVAAMFRVLSKWLPDLIIADSRAVAATLSKASTTSIRVVHEGTPHEEFERHSQMAPARNTSPVIGLVGRISPWKGQDVFVRAASIVHQKHPEARFRIIGAALFGEATFEQKLHALVEDLKVGPVVEFSGFRHDIHVAIAELDILVHASTRPEPFGQVIIEGMAAGKPVVATNAGGVPEIIEDGVTGYLVSMADAEGMAGVINKLLDDPEAALAVSVRGQQHVAVNFSITRTVQGVMAAYRQLLKIPLGYGDGN
jgi:glycosyltransferase involved in cell wall biosynthesis